MNELQPLIQWVTNLGGPAVTLVVAWLIYKEVLVLGREYRRERELRVEISKEKDEWKAACLAAMRNASQAQQITNKSLAVAETTVQAKT